MSNTATATAEAKTAAPPADAGRKAPEIDANACTLNVSGMCWQSFLVRLPEKMVAADLSDPKIWAKVQGGRCSLRELDQVTMISYDRSWMAEARVARADAASVVLARPTIISLPERFDKLPETETAVVKWMGNGYSVIRKSDGARLSQPVAILAMAARDLANIYPRGL